MSATENLSSYNEEEDFQNFREGESYYSENHLSIIKVAKRTKNTLVIMESKKRIAMPIENVRTSYNVESFLFNKKYYRSDCLCDKEDSLYDFPFGIFKGKNIFEIDRDYLVCLYLKSSVLEIDYPTIYEFIRRNIIDTTA